MFNLFMPQDPLIFISQGFKFHLYSFTKIPNSYTSVDSFVSCFFII